MDLEFRHRKSKGRVASKKPPSLRAFGHYVPASPSVQQNSGRGSHIPRMAPCVSDQTQSDKEEDLRLRDTIRAEVGGVYRGV